MTPSPEMVSHLARNTRVLQHQLSLEPRERFQAITKHLFQLRGCEVVDAWEWSLGVVGSRVRGRAGDPGSEVDEVCGRSVRSAHLLLPLAREAFPAFVKVTGLLESPLNGGDDSGLLLSIWVQDPGRQ